MRDEEVIKGAFQTSTRGSNYGNMHKKKYNFTKSKTKMTSKSRFFLPRSHCRRTNHVKEDCWYKNKPSFKCSFYNNLGHNKKFCRAKKK